MIIRTHNLSIALGQHTVLKNLSLTLKSGGITGILGPNGAGKSTLLRALAGLLVPHSGSVSYGSTTLSELTSEDLARYRAYLSQSPKSAWNLSVYDVVALGRLPIKNHPILEIQDHRILLETLDALDLKPFQHTPIHHLSAGEQARVYLARVLATQAPLLFLDEPTSAFDFTYQDKTLSLLKERGHTCVLILHDLVATKHYCDEVIVLREGTCVGQGSVMNPAFKDWITAGFGCLPKTYSTLF